MPDHTAVHFCDERYREGLGGAQRLDDELLRVVAYLQGLERRDGHLGNRADIVVRFVPDNDLGTHGLLFLSRVSQRYRPAAPDGGATRTHARGVTDGRFASGDFCDLPFISILRASL